MEDVCEVCSDGGELLICDRCESTWHEECHVLPLTEEERNPHSQWFCYRCRRQRRPIITEQGHLVGCYGRIRPNILAPLCRGELDDERPCAHLISKQSCVDRIGHQYFGYCPFHWHDHCTVMNYDPELSRCANEQAERLGIPLQRRLFIDDTNIEDILGLPQGANHVSEHRIKARRLADRNRRREFDRRMLNIEHDYNDHIVQLRAAPDHLFHDSDESVSMEWYSEDSRNEDDMRSEDSSYDRDRSEESEESERSEESESSDDDY